MQLPVLHRAMRLASEAAVGCRWAATRGLFLRTNSYLPQRCTKPNPRGANVKGYTLHAPVHLPRAPVTSLPPSANQRHQDAGRAQRQYLGKTQPCPLCARKEPVLNVRPHVSRSGLEPGYCYCGAGRELPAERSSPRSLPVGSIYLVVVRLQPHLR